MTDPVSLWYAFLVFEILFISLITIHAKSARFLGLVFFGSLIGFLFDRPAILLGFYTYNLGIDPVSIGNIPLTVSFAEGMAMSAIIFSFEAVSKKLRF